MDSENQNIIIHNTADGKASVSLYAKDGMVCMNQNHLAELFDTSKQNIGQHIANILKEEELDKESVVKNFFTTAADSKKYSVTLYSLDMILAVGFRVRSKRGTQFRIWANRNLKEFMIKGFVMDDERLKNLYPVPHRQYVFSIPKMLRFYFKYISGTTAPCWAVSADALSGVC